MFYPAKQIRPYRLWIGSEADSSNVAAARRRGVGLIVNCTRNLPALVPGLNHFRVPVDDTSDEGSTFLEHLPRAVVLIDEHLSRGHGVLVHCYAGVSRSASVVAAFLMYREGLTPRQAMARVRRMKPETFGDSPNFFKALVAFQEVLRPSTRQTRA